MASGLPLPLNSVGFPKPGLESFFLGGGGKGGRSPYILGCGRRGCPGSSGEGGLGSVVTVWVGAVPIRSGGDVELGCWRMLGLWGGDPDRTGPQPPPKGPNGGLGNRSSHPTAAM